MSSSLHHIFKETSEKDSDAAGLSETHAVPSWVCLFCLEYPGLSQREGNVTLLGPVASA